MTRVLGPVMLLMLSAAGFNGTSPPGKPVLTKCRSPEKETFTCWWKPGSDGGLPTVHQLYYEREGLNGILECPDYRSEGSNSCFFDKNHTSLWMEYSLTVVASNADGNATSDALKIDVAKIVQPHPPQNITVLVKQNDYIPYLNISWKNPPKTDKMFGWVTLDYELRVKEDSSEKWTNIEMLKQTFHKMYNVIPGATYEVEVRCRVDHGLWSEWSNSTAVKVPGHPLHEQPLLILVSTLSLIPLLATVCILIVKRKTVKQWLLPPVPGPKIRGVDVQLLKSGRSEDVTKALISNQNLSLMTTWTDQVEEYLIVFDSNDWLLPDPCRAEKRKKCLIAPAGFHFDSEIKCEESTPSYSDLEKAQDSRGEMDHLVNSSKSPSKEDLASSEPPQTSTEEQRCPSVNEEETIQRKTLSDNTVQLLPNTCYVDIQKHGNAQEVDVTQQEVEVTQLDYSRVKEVNGENIIILEKEHNPQSSTIKKREENVPEDYSRVKEVNGDDVVLLQRHNDSADSFCKKRDDRNTEWTNQKPKKPLVTEISQGICSELICNGYVDSAPNFSPM